MLPWKLDSLPEVRKKFIIHIDSGVEMLIWDKLDEATAAA